MAFDFEVLLKGLEQVMEHVLKSLKHGMVRQMDDHWDGSKNFEFEISGISDFGDATEPESHKRCGGLQVFLNKAHIAHKSKMQPSMSLSMAEGELITVVEAAQIMLFVIRVMEDIRLQVKKPMTLWVDCKLALGLMYGWNVSGLTKDMLVQPCFLCKLKELNQIVCVWIPTTLNMVDIYTKNVCQ